MLDATYWIGKLGLTPHPEGGFYRETYRAAGRIPAEALGGGHAGPRSFSTAIFYLLRGGEVSVLHRLRSDELFHFYAGSPLEVHVIDPEGDYRRFLLGSDAERGENLQVCVTAGCWFGATVAAAGSFSLVGCTVAPGFDFEDFERAGRAELVARYPRHRELIERLTR